MVFVLYGLFFSSPNWGMKWGKNADYKNSRHLLFFPRFCERAHMLARAMTEQGVFLAPCETFSDRILLLPRFSACFARNSGLFCFILLFQKIGLGKLLSINYLFGFFELKFLRVVRVYRGGDRTAQTMPRPDAHDFACNAGLFATADKRMPQLVRVVVGQQPLHARRNGVEVGVLRFFKVDIREYLFHHWCERNLPKHDVLPQPFLARFTL